MTQAQALRAAINAQGNLLSDPSDILWLLSTHLKGMSVAKFKSFVICGNADSPEAVLLYADADPLVSDKASIINFLEVTA
jgi:hypothetical protein